MRRFEPRDLVSILKLIDVNYLGDREAMALSTIDVETDEGIRRLVDAWMVPEIRLWSDVDRADALSILEQADDWPESQLRAAFDLIELPSGQKVTGARRFVSEVRRALVQYDSGRVGEIGSW